MITLKTQIKHLIFIAFLITPNIGTAQSLFPLPIDQEGVLSVNWENDIFSGADDNYTNGVRFAWFSSEAGVPQWLDNSASMLPFFPNYGEKRYSFSLGQSMFTPRNISISPPDSNDRPYAGWTYLGVGLVSDTGARLDSLQLQLGVVGESSLADGTQDFVHHLIDSPDPQGWDYQLKDEPGIVLTYQRKWRNLLEMSPFGLAVDVSPHIGGALGNVFTYASTGAIFRLGWDLPSDYAPPLIQPSLPGSDFFRPNGNWGGYLFAGVEGRAVARNIFLDGNTFRDSPSVDKEHFVGDLQVGMALTIEDYRIAYTHIFRTREFKTQEQADSFGAITFSVRF